ncbi:MAG TPA: hypothetical protein VFV33_07760 [Gemmatimonadaceae bacterium]|nr:hypothetical protein [Gemmatimonadaceae bacterium]
MLRLSRSLATRLRRLAAPRGGLPRSSAPRPPSAEAWARLERALTATALPAPATRRRELAHEQVRLTVTLVGQQGTAAVSRIRATAHAGGLAGDEAREVALSVAAAMGHPA